jgi:hypothetical protein
MSDYLTNLATTLTNPEPAVRPRLGARFESTRPVLPGIGYQVASIRDPEDAPPHALNPQHPTPAGGGMVVPIEHQDPGTEYQAPRGRPTPSSAQSSVLHTGRRRTPPPALSELAAAHTPSERPQPAPQTPFVDRVNAAGTFPRQPQQAAAATTATAVKPPELPVSDVAADSPVTTAPKGRIPRGPEQSSAVQRQSRLDAMPGAPVTQPAPALGRKADAMVVEPISPAAVARSRPLAQAVEPHTPHSGRLATAQVQPSPDLAQTGTLAPVVAPGARRPIRPGSRGAIEGEQPPERLPNMRPAVGLRSITPATQSDRLSTGAQTAPAAPTIRVTIGRVEVRVTAPPAPVAPSKSTVRKPIVSLEEYLAQRNGDRR